MSDSQMITIEGNLRQQRKKSYCRSLRLAGKIPANILGKSESTPIELDSKWLSKAWQSGRKFNLKLGEDLRPVKIQELQVHATSRKALHVDLMYI
tara:strand:- start:83 stop:367 length:285 start_codon:yes stop_codon:yes gene_type:complete